MDTRAFQEASFLARLHYLQYRYSNKFLFILFHTEDKIERKPDRNTFSDMVNKEEHEEQKRSVALAAKKAALSEKHGNKKDGEGGSSLTTPSSWESFDQSEGVKLHLVVKDTQGKEVASIPFTKKQFSTGSYGWTLTDKIVVENAEGGNMSVTVNSNCEYQDSYTICELIFVFLTPFSSP